MEMSKRERKRRGNSRYYLYFVVTLICIAIAGVGVWYALTNVSLFRLQTITMSGNKAIPDSLIYKLTQPYLGQNLFALNASSLEKKLQSLSRIKEVKVHKKLLATLHLEITERTGVIYLKSYEGDLHPMDSDGVILAKYSPVYSEDLPVFSSYISNSSLKAGKKLTNPGVRKILAMQHRIAKEAPDFLADISEYYLIDNTVNIIDAKYGTRIIPSDEDMAKQLARYKFVQDNGNIDKRSVVDLRYKNQVVVKAGNK